MENDFSLTKGYVGMIILPRKRSFNQMLVMARFWNTNENIISEFNIIDLMAFLGEKTKKAASLSETSLQCKCVFGEELKLTAAWEKTAASVTRAIDGNTWQQNKKTTSSMNVFANMILW